MSWRASRLQDIVLDSPIVTSRRRAGRGRSAFEEHFRAGVAAAEQAHWPEAAKAWAAAFKIAGRGRSPA